MLCWPPVNTLPLWLSAEAGPPLGAAASRSCPMPAKPNGSMLNPPWSSKSAVVAGELGHAPVWMHPAEHAEPPALQKGSPQEQLATNPHRKSWYRAHAPKFGTEEYQQSYVAQLAKVRPLFCPRWFAFARLCG